MYELKPNNDALSIYWDKCKHWFDKFELDVSYAEFAAKYNGLDIYGLNNFKVNFLVYNNCTNRG